MLSNKDIVSLLPFIITAAGVIVLLLTIAVKRNHSLTHVIAYTTLIAAFASLFYVAGLTPHVVGKLYIIDDYALLYMGLIFLASWIVILFSKSYLEQMPEKIEEYYILILLATLGSATLTASHHFISFFLGIEVLSTSLYTLIAYLRERESSFEAGIKYLILAAASSAFLLFGMALVYADSGTMYFPQLASMMKMVPISMLTLGGFGLIIVGIGFKLALVPFHMWTPDVYEGAPAPVTAFIATVSKGGVFALWLRFIMDVDAYRFPSFIYVIGIIAAASMLAGNVLALLQNNVKRILAYSSIAHLGYLLVAFLTATRIAVEASTFYLVVYMITTLGAFGIVTTLSGKDRDATTIDDYRGLFKRKPFLATLFAIMLLSLAGIPLTAGFISKFYVLMAGVEANLWWLVIILIVSSTIGLFYYLRIVVAMFSPPAEEVVIPEAPALSATNAFVFTLLTVLIIGLGTYPTVLIQVIKLFTGSL